MPLQLMAKVTVHHLLKQQPTQDGHRLVHQRERAVLHLARKDALAVHQGHLLHLHRWVVSERHLNPKCIAALVRAGCQLRFPICMACFDQLLALSAASSAVA